MPRASSGPIRSVLVIGSGPIVIGQACEFDYSGTQALKAFKRNGIRTILINPNPATIMTDPELADRTYLEPLTPETLEKVLIAERPDAVLPTMGGQTALNLVMEAHRRGILRRRRVRLIGATPRAINYAENRRAFRRRMSAAGLPLPKGFVVSDAQSLVEGARRLGFPVLMRTSFTLGGLGSGIFHDEERLREAHHRAVQASPHAEVLVEEYLAGHYEFELEVMRDCKDNCIVVCSIENVDPMGVHTGDSVTVAPAQTLTDGEYQEMRQMAFACIRAVGVDTGGANVQFAQDPRTRRLTLIEMNPRVSRSSALASKATGVPIAAIAAELALGKTLDQIRNPITGKTTAAFEPALDYVVVKVPLFQFAKFDVRETWLDTSMKSVGEAMAIGRTFPEAAQKAMRSLEEGHPGLAMRASNRLSASELALKTRRPNPYRLIYAVESLARGRSAASVASATGIHPWFIDQLDKVARCKTALARGPLSPGRLREAKELGFSNEHIAALSGRSAGAARRPSYCEVDTCAGEFEAGTPYYYSTHHAGGRNSRPVRRKASTKGKTFVVLASGPNRIGEGLEFDYSCVHAAQTVRAAGHEVVLINSNPETVSTDYDVADRLYIEPVALEEVQAVLERERPQGVILQFGGQQPLILAGALHERGWNILGTPVDAIARSEEREKFARSLKRLKIPYPQYRYAPRRNSVLHMAHEVGFPVLVRPSYVMGGDRIRIFKHPAALESYLAAYPEESGGFIVDRFLNQAVELDVDAVCDGRDVEICGILEHIEPAGIHSGDSSMIYPPVNLSARTLALVEEHTRKIAHDFSIRGICNLQFALVGETPYVIELNARASRTVPILSKATGVPWAAVATRILLGHDLKSAMRPYRRRTSKFYYAKASAFCFYRFPGPPPALGPEMRSTGESLGVARTPEEALTKARLSAGQESLGRLGGVHCLQDL